MSWTVLGALGAPGRAQVDERGRLAPAGMPWVVDWLVGGEERWHEAATDAAVRQSVEGPGVVVTRVRVPGGDVVHRAWAVPAPAGAAAVAVVELENASPVPVVAAVCVRPAAGGNGPATVSVDATGVSADGQVVVRPGRPVRAAVAGPTGPSGARAVAMAGEAGPPPVAARREEDGPEAVALWPLPHRTSLRMAIRLAPGTELPPPDDVPGPDAVTRGWTRHLDEGATVETGDGAVDRAVRGWLHRLLLASEEHEADDASVALVAMALAEWGLTTSAVELLGARFADAAPESAGPLLAAAARVTHLGPDRVLVGPGLALASRSASALGRPSRSWRPRRGLRPPWPASAAGSEAWAVVWAELGLHGAAGLADVDGQLEASAALGKAAARLARRRAHRDDPAQLLRGLFGPAPSGAVEPAAGPAYLALAGASAARADRPDAVRDALGEAPARSDEPTTAALLAMLVRRTLVDETGEGLDLLPAPLVAPGVAVEALGLPTVHGRLGFAIRWHGERPALLWELDATPTSAPTSIRAPAFDEAFVRTEPRGEALLSEPG